MKVNVNLLPIKGHYFFLFGASAPMIPFLPVFGQQLGLGSGIPLVYTVLPFAAVVTKLLTGGIADAKGLHKTVLLSSLIVTAVGLFSLYFTPNIPNSPVYQNVSLDCSQPFSYFRYEHKKEPCGQRDYLSAITSPANATCTVHCINAEELVKLCGHDQLNIIQNYVLNFTAVIDLQASDREKSVSYLRISNVHDYGNLSSCHDSLFGYKYSSDGTAESNGSIQCSSITRVHDCLISCDDIRLMDYLDRKQSTRTLADVLQYPQFWMFLVLMVISWSNFSAVTTLSDTVCFMLLGEDGRSQYGRQRVWGAVSWGLFVMLAGALIDTVSRNSSIKDYTPAFVLTLAMFSFDLYAACKIKLPQDPPPAGINASLLSCLCWGSSTLRLIAQPRVLLFVLSCIVVGASTGALWTYQFMLVEQVAQLWKCSSLDHVKALEGLIIGIQCYLGELPFFLLAGIFLSRLGHIVCMTVVIFVFGLRFVLYSTVENPWLFLPIEVLQGLTFGLFYSTMTSYAYTVAVPGTEATVQALISASFEGLGIAIGNSIGGVLFFQYGGKSMYKCFGIFNICFAILFALGNFTINRCQRRSNGSSQSGRHQLSMTSATDLGGDLSSSEGMPALLSSS